MSFECNLKANRLSKIGRITVKDYKNFKLSLNEVTKEFEVVGKDGHVWGAGASTKGAVISACNCGVRLKDIDIHEAYVPLAEVIEAIKS